MKKSELLKSIIIDVICASAGDITEDYFKKLRMLFKEYNSWKSLEAIDEEN